ncbi:NADPH oxidase 4-like isoform X1 [Macrosteles quadrilineatus]|uniref:NADPH oxidase 4-like isoform X1 n=2 Tax=Macrosteles quadrilineatus TaxID=74068 RepID=UPI0023E245F3|nr:NADPH oxidase 4-like isoform X1 [Macrosteles quadrilineatus]
MAFTSLSSHRYLILWILLNSAIFYITYQKYLQPQYFHLQSMLGRGLCISRASATVINLNSALVLLPVCRGLNSLLYRLLSRVSRTLLALWLAHLKSIHITLALTIVVAAVVHSAAHFVNSANFSQHYDAHHPEINWAKYKGQSPVVLILSSSVGLTGVGMLLILLLLLILSLSCVRERYYDIFWATHFLFLPFMICLILHPLSGVLKEQSNYPHNLLECDEASSNMTISETCHANPTFTSMECQGWLWVVAALGISLSDCLLRSCRRNYSVYQVTQAVDMSGGVTHLTLRTDHTVRLNPGQYVLLQCPRLSSLEWHPFTVTSVSCSTSHTYISLLIRRRGDWTKAVCRLLSKAGRDNILPHSVALPRILVDGPFCSPLENVVKARLAICIAAGIGITPFIAVLHHLYKSDSVRWGQERPHHLHLLWVVRSQDQLTWAADLITQLHHKCWSSNYPDKFDFSLYITKGNAHQGSLSLSNLIQKRTYFGRPNWRNLFSEWALLYHKKEVSVFTCGPSSLHRQVKSAALKFNSKGTRFNCVQESFS